jgi:hypothetical protein
MLSMGLHLASESPILLRTRLCEHSCITTLR